MASVQVFIIPDRLATFGMPCLPASVASGVHENDGFPKMEGILLVLRLSLMMVMMILIANIY